MIGTNNAGDVKVNRNTEGMGASVTCRETAKGRMRGMIDRKQRELTALRTLYDSLPDAMLEEADEALWSILCAAR